MPMRAMRLIPVLGICFTALAAQQPVKIPRVGFLAPQDRSLSLFDEFRQGFADLGYVEGKNIVFEPRFAEGHHEKLPDLASDLVRERVDVIVVNGVGAAWAAKKATPDIPVVFASWGDPVWDNLVTNLQRPGGNISGLTTLDPQQLRKQLELLRQTIPGLKQLAVLGEADVSDGQIRSAEKQAHAMGFEALPFLVATSSPDLDGAFAAMRKEHAGALLVLDHPVVGLYAKQIAQLALANHIPSLAWPNSPEIGQLLAYGTSFGDGMRHTAVYVDKVLKGSKVGDLPVETFTRYELVVNLKTAREIGLTIPADVLQRADHVIQ
jgi:putative tryptophan/tyrosine transport system substrate-binding protein